MQQLQVATHQGPPVVAMDELSFKSINEYLDEGLTRVMVSEYNQSHVSYLMYCSHHELASKKGMRP